MWDKLSRQRYVFSLSRVCDSPVSSTHEIGSPICDNIRAGIWNELGNYRINLTHSFIRYGIFLLFIPIRSNAVAISCISYWNRTLAFKNEHFVTEIWVRICCVHCSLCSVHWIREWINLRQKKIKKCLKCDQHMVHLVTLTRRKKKNSSEYHGWNSFVKLYP